MPKEAIYTISFIFLLVASYIAAETYFHFISKFAEVFPDSRELNDWGNIGSFFGGMLNAIFSFFGFVMLLLTLIQNQYGLELTREELKKSAAILGHIFCSFGSA